MHGTLVRSRALLLLILAAVMLSPALVATSAEAKPTHYRVGIKLSDTNVVVGDTVRVSGSVRPLTTGRVILQHRVAGVWKKLKTVKLVASGYATTVSFADPGVEFLRVVRPGGKGHTKGQSKTRTVRVLNHATNPQISTAALPAGSVGTPYTTRVQNADGRAGRWSISQGALPPGLTIAAATGVITGTPTAKGTSQFGVFFKDQDGRVAGKVLSIAIDETADNQLIVTTSLPAAVKGEAYSAQLKTKDGRVGTWNVSTGALPAGLTLAAATGVISGTPTETGSFPFQVRFRDTLGVSDTQDLTLVVAASKPVISTTSLPKGKVNTAYTAALKTADNRPGTWSISVGTLPAGLVLNASTGAITGTPTERGTSTFTVKFKDEAGVEVTKDLSIQIQACLLFICV